jgi:hypothetical protein
MYLNNAENGKGEFCLAAPTVYVDRFLTSGEYNLSINTVTGKLYGDAILSDGWENLDMEDILSTPDEILAEELPHLNEAIEALRKGAKLAGDYPALTEGLAKNKGIEIIDNVFNLSEAIERKLPWLDEPFADEVKRALDFFESDYEKGNHALAGWDRHLTKGRMINDTTYVTQQIGFSLPSQAWVTMFIKQNAGKASEFSFEPHLKSFTDILTEANTMFDELWLEVALGHRLPDFWQQSPDKYTKYIDVFRPVFDVDGKTELDSIRHELAINIERQPSAVDPEKSVWCVSAEDVEYGDQYPHLTYTTLGFARAGANLFADRLTEQIEHPNKKADAVRRELAQEREIETAAYVLQDNHGAPQCGVETMYFKSYEDLAGYLDAHLDVNDRITEGYAIVTDGDRYRAAMQKPVTPSQEKRAASVDELAARGREKADAHNKNLKNNDRPNLGKRSR